MALLVPLGPLEMGPASSPQHLSASVLSGQVRPIGQRLLIAQRSSQLPRHLEITEVGTYVTEAGMRDRQLACTGTPPDLTHRDSG